MGVARSIAGVQPFAELFQGATTTVFKGYEPSSDRFVLLKVLRPEFSADEVIARRFEEEARMASRIEHPNVVKVHSFGRGEEGTYIIAEFIEGMNLRALIETGKLPPELAAYILLQVAYGLQAAHGEGILHRDIKPENILISHEGHVKLADFGMASFTESLEDAAEIRGTLGYLSPEQVLGEPLSPSSDLFSLGATFYEMLTGRAAFIGAQLAQIFDAIVHFDPVPYLEVDRTAPPVFVQICSKLLAKNPPERYTDTVALISDLEASLAPLGEAVGQVALQVFLQAPAEYKSPGYDLYEPVPSLSGDGHADGMLETEIHTPGERSVRVGAAKRSTKRRVLTGAVAVLSLLLIGLIVWSSMFDAGWRITFMRADLAAGDSALTAADSLLLASRYGPESGILIDSVASAPAGSGNNARDGRSGSARTTSLEGNLQNPGRLLVDCRPWCSVSVDGVHVGDSPITTPVAIQAGKRQVTLRHNLYPEVLLTVEVEPGETEQLRVVLDDYVGHVMIRVDPYATIFIDGTERDQTPLKEPLRLSPGTHRLALVHDELGTYETDIEVKEGESKQFEFNLEELLNK